MTRVVSFVVVLLVLAGAGLALQPWVNQQLESRARAAYFSRGQAYAPRVLEELAPLPPELREASGLSLSRTQPGVVWAHNDSGDAPVLYAIDLKGKLLAKVGVMNATATDWEDISSGPCPSGIGTGRPSHGPGQRSADTGAMAAMRALSLHPRSDDIRPPPENPVA